MPLYDEWLLSSSDDTAATSEFFRTPVIARSAARRALVGETDLATFARPELGHLHRGELIAGMGEACQRVERSIRDGEQILIYGDYDVDGVTSIVLLSHVIRSLGGKVDFVVPHRLVDGYGLKLSVLERVLTEKAVKLVITVDCGITSIEPVSKTLERGIDVIVTDHHLPPDALPEALAILNPKKPGCVYPFKELAGVGVAFKFACELMNRAKRSVPTASLLKIAALGTIADVAPLIGENRTIARIGLDGLGDPRNVGLRALVRGTGLLGRKLKASDVGFKIGPRINAAGRLASADTAIRLFSATVETEADAMVEELNQLNVQRQGIERLIIAEAEQMIAARGELPPVLLLAGEGWHKGVLGLCAGRIMQRFNRPTLVVSLQDGECVGSGRSITTVNLHALLSEVRDCFTHFGGHEFACGFSMSRPAFERFRAEVIRVGASLPASAFRRTATIEADIRLAELSAGFLLDHEALEPFGAGNRQPIFVSREVRVGEVKEFAPGCRSVMLQQDGVWYSSVLWPAAGELTDVIATGAYADVAYTIEPDRYGRNGLRLQIVDAARAGNAPLRNESSAGAV